GKIDELAVYGRPADVAEIQSIYNADGAGKANQMGNGNEGIEIYLATGTTIGGTATGAGNVISANRGGTGLWIHSDGAARNLNTLVQGNKIGTNPDGMLPEPNRYSGLTISDGAGGVTVGGTTAGAGNVISGNTYAGIYMPSASNLVQGN